MKPVLAWVFAFYVVGVSVLYANYMPDLMAAVGVRGAFLNGLIFGPLVLLGAIHARTALRSSIFRRSSLLVGVVTLSAAWSSHDIDSATKLHALLVCLAGASVFLARPDLIGPCVIVAIVPCITGIGFYAMGAATEFHADYQLALFAILGWMHIGEGARPRRIRTPIVYALCTAVVFTSAVRAATIAAALAIAVRHFGARTMLITATAIPFFVLAQERAPREAPRPEMVERADVVGRLQTAREDRLSNRLDIWEDTILAAYADPHFSPVGIGIGDVDYLVAEAHPDEAIETRDGSSVMSCHNMLLELILAAGALAALASVWLGAAVVRTLKLGTTGTAAVITIVVVGGANCFAYNLGGAALLLGLAVVACEATERKKPGPLSEPGQKTSHLSRSVNQFQPLPCNP